MVMGQAWRRSEGGSLGNIANVNSYIELTNISQNCLLCKKLGNGEKTKFWQDIWCGNDTFWASFPRLATLDKNIECTAADQIDSGTVNVGIGEGRLPDAENFINWKNWKRGATESLLKVVRTNGSGGSKVRAYSLSPLYGVPLMICTW